MTFPATMRLAIVGDSITNGYGVPAGQGFASLLESRDLPGRLLALGRDGATTRRWLPGGPHYSALDQLAPFTPTHVLVELGLNEWNICRKLSDYTAHLVSLAGEIRQRIPAVPLIFLHTYPGEFTRHPGDCDIQPCSPASPAPSWHDYGRAMWEAATNVQAAYIDVAEGRSWSPLLGADKAHLTAYGHFLLYTAVRSQLLDLV